MSLVAIVYRNPCNLNAFIKESAYEVDELTGEVIFVSARPEVVVAEQVKFGNIAEVAYLRNIVKGFKCPSESIICNRILYSGSHSGDVIPIDNIEMLEKEISYLRTYGHPALLSFLDGVSKLILAARCENNPIVFV